MKEATSHHHEPVLLREVLDLLQPRTGGLYCDGTAGRGGHAQALLEASAPEGRLVAVDRDPEAVAAVAEKLASFGSRAHVVHGRFGALRQLLSDMELGGEKLDGLLVDLGVSSAQLDEPGRGLSFQQEGPIDMRLDPSSGETALDVVGRLSEDELARVLRDYGEERRFRRVARAIKDASKRGELATTLDLARVVRRAVGKPRTGKIDAATRTFQALRIYVNQELAELEALLTDLPELLAEGGRAALISFHSLEDRAVKHGLRRWAGCRCAPKSPRCTCGGPVLRLLAKKPILPSEEEVRRNPRSRSAKLRGAERLGTLSLEKREEAPCA